MSISNKNILDRNVSDMSVSKSKKSGSKRAKSKKAESGNAKPGIAKSKTEKTGKIIHYSFVLVMLVAGALLNILGVGLNNKLGFGSVGNWMIFVGFMSLFIAVLKGFNKRVVDERMHYISFKASKVTFLVLILVLFAIMIADTISPVSVPVYMLMNYLICGIILVQVVAQKVIARYN